MNQTYQRPKLENVLLMIFEGNLLKLWEAMILECLSCRGWLSRKLLPFQLELAGQSALHAHLDTENPLVLVYFGRISPRAKPRKIFTHTHTPIKKLSLGEFSLFL